MKSPSLSPTPSQRSESREHEPKILAVGLESVGKTQLLSRLSGRFATPESFRGSTLACDAFTEKGVTWIDTPGLYRESETKTSSATRKALAESDQILLVVRADQVIEHLETLLPIVTGKKGAIVLTFADRLPSSIERSQMQ
ncbi:MAG: GTPase domain-containing protein, partial [Verrucomicrobiota bacterium]